MKRENKIFTPGVKYPVIVLLVTFFFTSCLQSKSSELENQAYSLILQINAPQSKVLTRSQDIKNGIVDENTITSLYLYFFDEQGALKYTMPIETSSIKEGDDIYIHIKADDAKYFQGNVRYTVYAVANFTELARIENLDEFKSTVIKTEIGKSASSFVMVASVTPDYRLNLNDKSKTRIGTFKLKRLAVKVRLKININLPNGYKHGDLNAILMNAVNCSYLDNPDVPKETTFTNIEIPSGNEKVSYTYSNYWSENNGKETYLYLILPICKGGGAQEKKYYYRITLEESKVLPNHLYDVTVNIKQLGSIDPEDPKSLNGLLSVKDWVEEESPASELTTPHYLVLSETSAEMKMVDDYEIPYQTSDLIEIINKNAVFVYVDNSTGKEVRQNINSEEEQFPSIEVDDERKKIMIKSQLPINYIPKTITFMVKHKTYTGIDPVEVTIRQYPSTFITNTIGESSSWRPGGEFAWTESQLNNKAIYRITTLVPNSSSLPVKGAVIGFPPTEKKIFYGRELSWFSYNYIPEHTDNLTVESNEVANMISPNFEMASQLGATVPVNSLYVWWDSDKNGFLRYYPFYQEKRYAHHTCAMYTETRMLNGEPEILDDWRVPTQAELKLINYMQKKAGSAVNKILTGDYYWSNIGSTYIGGGTPNDHGAVRCVRDVKE